MRSYVNAVRAFISLLIISIMALGVAAPAFALPNNAPDASVQTNGRVDAIVTVGNTVYLGGQFSTVRAAGAKSGGVTRNNIAAIDATTGALTSFDPETNGVVQAIAVASDGTVYFGGTFSNVAGQARANLAAIAPDGTLSSWAPTANATVLSLLVNNSTGTVYIGGMFGKLNNTQRPNIGSVSTAGILSTWNPIASSRVQSIVTDGANMYLTGNFNTFAGTAHKFAVETDLNGTVINTWKPKVLATVINATAANGNVYLAEGGGGGTIQALTGSTGATLWSAKSDGNIQAVAATASTVYVGGHFQNFGSNARNKLAAFDAVTGAITAWNPTANSALGVWALNVSPTHLYAGGDFTTVNGIKQQGFAQFSGTL